MLTAKLLNSNASLNQFKYLATLEFMLETDLRLAFRLFDSQTSERHVPPSTAIVTLTFNTGAGETFDKVATVIDSGDRSMLYVELSDVETADLMGGSITFKVDVLGDGNQIMKGYISSALSKIITECC